MLLVTETRQIHVSASKSTVVEDALSSPVWYKDVYLAARARTHPSKFPYCVPRYIASIDRHPKLVERLRKFRKYFAASDAAHRRREVVVPRSCLPGVVGPLSCLWVAAGPGEASPGRPRAHSVLLVVRGEVGVC